MKFKVTTLNADETSYHRCNNTHPLHLERLFEIVLFDPGFVLCVQEIGRTVNACNRLEEAVGEAFGGEIGSCSREVDRRDFCHIIWDASVWTLVGEQRAFDLTRDEDHHWTPLPLRRGERNNRARIDQQVHDHTRPRIQHITLRSTSGDLDIINLHLYHTGRTGTEKQNGVDRLSDYADIRSDGELVITGDFNLREPRMELLERSTDIANVMNTFHRAGGALIHGETRYVVPECTQADCVQPERRRLLGHPVLEHVFHY